MLTCGVVREGESDDLISYVDVGRSYLGRELGEAELEEEIVVLVHQR